MDGKVDNVVDWLQPSQFGGYSFLQGGAAFASRNFSSPWSQSVTGQDRSIVRDASTSGPCVCSNVHRHVV